MLIPNVKNWENARKSYNWEVNLGCFINKANYPDYFNRTITLDNVEDFEKAFRVAINQFGSFEVAGEVCFWKNYRSRQKNSLTLHLLRHLAKQDNWKKFVEALIKVSNEPTYKNFMNHVDACNQRNGFATPITFLAFYNPDKYSMADRHIANWWTENKSIHGRGDSPVFSQRKDGWIYNKESSWEAYMAWTEFCQECAKHLSKYSLSDDSRFRVLKSKKITDIVVCREDIPRAFFLEVKLHTATKGRIGIGSQKGEGFQPEIVEKNPRYFEKCLRWILCNDDIENEKKFVFASTEMIKRYLMGGRVGQKQNNIDPKIFDKKTLLTEMQLIEQLISWLTVD